MDSAFAPPARPGMTAVLKDSGTYGRRLCAFQYRSRLEISAGLKWQ
jgi:hypothetical protein